jgi:hypothetical protein
MTKSLLLAATLLLLTVTTSFAQRGTLSLGWNNCRVNGGGVPNATFACNTNDGEGPLLVGSFTPNASANLQSLNSAYLYVDIYQSDTNLNAWWQFTDPPVVGCRSLAFWNLDVRNAAGATCDRSYWSEVGSPVSVVRWFFPTYRPNHGTLRILVAVNGEWSTRRRRSALAKSRSSRCASRQSGVHGSRLVPDCCSVSPLFRRGGFFQSNFDNFTIDAVGPGNYPGDGPKCATWQVTPPVVDACPNDGSPVRNTTWGSIKSIYR